MFLELHMLQNFAPSNLNRDDTGSPKDCEFGGYRRARISSQCIKRSIRTEFKKNGLVPVENQALRTKRLVSEVAGRLVLAGRDRDAAEIVVVNAIGGLGLSVVDDQKTQYLLFLGTQELERITEACQAHWDTLCTRSTSEEIGKKAKKAAKAVVPKEVADVLKAALDGGKAADLALFGRMLADLPEKNVNAACQVAHAISANRVQPEFDFYVAIDDLKPDDTAGADMIGTVEFNSACFYRYANVDLGELTKNLGGDLELTRATIEAFLRASITAIPTGKQNSMAAQNPPALVFAVVRERGLWSLANAFTKPVAPNRDRDLVQGSIAALDDHWGKMTRMFGEDGVLGVWVAALDGDGGLTHLKGNVVANVSTLIANVVAAVSTGQPSEAA